LQIFKKGGKTVFTVTDNGSGIPIEFQQSIFQIFKTLVEAMAHALTSPQYKDMHKK
jgi:C4-dicarboxylate-specific signal transduction histidine kinase